MCAGLFSRLCWTSYLGCEKSFNVRTPSWSSSYMLYSIDINVYTLHDPILLKKIESMSIFSCPPHSSACRLYTKSMRVEMGKLNNFKCVWVCVYEFQVCIIEKGVIDGGPNRLERCDFALRGWEMRGKLCASVGCKGKREITKLTAVGHLFFWHLFNERRWFVDDVYLTISLTFWYLFFLI